MKINGQKATLVSGLYRLPRLVGCVQIDCPVTDNYNTDSHVNHWGIVKNAQFRLWPKGHGFAEAIGVYNQVASGQE